MTRRGSRHFFQTARGVALRSFPDKFEHSTPTPPPPILAWAFLFSPKCFPWGWGNFGAENKCLYNAADPNALSITTGVTSDQQCWKRAGLENGPGRAPGRARALLFTARTGREHKHNLYEHSKHNLNIIHIVKLVLEKLFFSYH